MKSRIKTVADVARWRLCLGCGACAYICPEKKISLVDFLEEGIRPVLSNARPGVPSSGAPEPSSAFSALSAVKSSPSPDPCSNCTACLDVCPACENDHTEINHRRGILPELKESCGPVLEVWEGHASDSQTRFLGSSGGLMTALSAYCLERLSMHGVLHIGGDPADPI